jgi:uncharacterized protein
MSPSIESGPTRRRRLTALVTGASSGIGMDFAHLLAEKECDLVLVARRLEPLHEVAKAVEAKHSVKVTVLTADLADPTAPERLVQQLEDQHIEVDLLVNNAGYTMDGHLLAFPWEQHDAYVRVMATAPAELIYRLLPGMLSRGFGQVINVASIGGLIPSSPFNTLYGPTKNFLVVLTRTLATEYGAAGISFSVVCPGPVAETGIVGSTAHGAGWARFPWLLSTPRDVTSRAYRAMLSGKVVQPVGIISRVLTLTARVLPTTLMARLTGASVMFLAKEKRIRSAQDAGVVPDADRLTPPAS